MTGSDPQLYTIDKDSYQHVSAVVPGAPHLGVAA